MKLEAPKRWNSLPEQHRSVLCAMMEMLDELKRWPMIPELAERLERTKSSIKNSLMWLVDRQILRVTRFGKSMPPSYEIAGVEITFKVDLYAGDYDLGMEKAFKEDPLTKKNKAKAAAKANRS